MQHRRAPRGPGRPSPLPPPRPAGTNAAPSARVRLPLLAAALLPVAVAIAVYAPTLRNGFVWDDPLVLAQLRDIDSVADLIALPPSIPKFYYRPVIFITYLIDRSFAGESPFWFHASVVGAHALNTFLVFLVARRLFDRDDLVASCGALLFAVFPTHVESVAWMAGRSDVVACTFILLTILLFLDRRHTRAPWLGAGTYFLALLSKELAVAVLVLVPIIDLLEQHRLRWIQYVPLGLATAIYIAMRNHAIGTPVGGSASGAGAMEIAASLLQALGVYVERSLLPLDLSPYVPEVPGEPVYGAIAALAVLGSVALAVTAWRRRQWGVTFLVAWFFIMLAPSLTVIVRRSASAAIADRYLYVPSVASCVLIAWGVVVLMRRWRAAPPWAGAVAIGALGIAFGAQTVAYGRVWRDNYAFWSVAAESAPGHGMPHRELAAALLDRGDVPGAEKELRLALTGKSDPEGRVMTHNNLGNVYRRMKRYDEAIESFEAALAIAPHPTTYHNLGMTLMQRAEVASRQGDSVRAAASVNGARAAFERALSFARLPGATERYADWSMAKTHSLLGQVLLALGDRDGARRELEAALRLEPTGPIAQTTREYLQRLSP